MEANPPFLGVNWFCPMNVAMRAANVLVGLSAFASELDPALVRASLRCLLQGFGATGRRARGTWLAASFALSDVHAALTPEQRATAKANYTEKIATAGFPAKPDGSKMTYRAAVKTGVVFKDSKNKVAAKQFVAFMLEKENFDKWLILRLLEKFPEGLEKRSRSNREFTISQLYKSEKYLSKFYDVFMQNFGTFLS